MKDFDTWNEIKKQIQNENAHLGYKNRDIFYIKMGHNIGFEKNGVGNENIAILSQVRLFSTKRLLNKIGVIKEEDFKNLKNKLKDLID